MNSSDGIPFSNVESTTAERSDVLEGKTFYSKLRTPRSGTMVDRGAHQFGTWIATDSVGFYIQSIPEGYYHNNGTDWGPHVGYPIDDFYEYFGGNHGAWSATVNAGGSVTIPKGFHNGSGVVRANSVQSSLKTASFNLSLSSGGGGYGETKDAWWSPGGTVIGMTKCDIRTDTESDLNSANKSYCEISNGQVHFVTNYTHRGGASYASGTVVYI